MKVYKQASPNEVLTSFYKRREVGVSRVKSSLTKAVFTQVGGGRVSLTGYVLLLSFTSWELS